MARTLMEVGLVACACAAACGGQVAPDERPPSAQAVVIDAAFVCPTGLEPAFRSGKVGICTDGSMSIDDIPEDVCLEVGLSSCAQLDAVTSEATPEVGVAPLDPVTSEAMPEVGVAPGAVPNKEACQKFDLETLVPATEFADCDQYTPTECPAGTHIFFSESAACPVCVADTPENCSCAWAEACFVPFIQAIAHSSGAKSCAEDSDCSVMNIDAGCGPLVVMALNGFIDEEIAIAAELYSQQNCSLCTAADDTSALGGSAHCVSGVCQID